MAKDLELKTNVNAPTSDYPSGQIRNDDGSGNGTPVTESVYGDSHQFFAKLMRDAKINPNNLNDNTTNGFQLNQALQLNQGVSFFNSLSSGGSGNIGKWVKMYEVEIQNSFGTQELSFDIYSIGTIGAIRRRAEINIIVKGQEALPFTAWSSNWDFNVSYGELVGFDSNEIKATLINDDADKKTIGIFFQYKYNNEIFSAITRSNISGILRQFTQDTIVAAPIGSLDFIMGWSSVGILFTGGTSFDFNANYPIEFLSDGDKVKLRGRIEKSAGVYTGEQFLLPVEIRPTETITFPFAFGAANGSQPELIPLRIVSSGIVNFDPGALSSYPDLFCFDNIEYYI